MAARSAGRCSIPIFCARLVAMVEILAQRTTEGAGKPALRRSVIGTSVGHAGLPALVIINTQSNS